MFRVKMRGKFIVVEGIDGNGKTTQAKLIARYFGKKGKKIFMTREPSRSKYGRRISYFLLHPPKRGITTEEWLELFTLDRLEHVKNEILPAVRKGKVVICSRYFYSTLAYQLKEKEWKNYAKRFLKPNLAFVFDVPANIAISRIKERMMKKGKKFSYFEKKKLLERLRKNYKKEAKHLKEIRIIDSRPSPDKIFEKVKKELEKL